jgi:DNA (cytosine-5)-methyltransferase 1
MSLRIGSLFSGYGGLDMAVSAVLDIETVWVCDNDPAAAKVLAARYPGIPNLGDITAVNWDSVKPVDIICGGFPCQDVSLAGLRAGMRNGTRSGLWAHFANAIDALRPQLVFIENVRSLTSAWADSAVESCTWCVGDAGDEHSLRALGAVLGDLAARGFDARWQVVRASDVGAAHRRERVFILAWPAADTDDLRRQRGGRHGDGGLDLRTAVAALVPHADGAAGNQRRLAAPGQAEAGGARPDARGRGGAPADVSARGVGSMRPTPRATDGTNGGPNMRGSSGDLALPSAVAQLLPTPDATHGRKTTRTGPLLPGITDWGPFAAAIARWGSVLGRAAPDARDHRGRLSPLFVEWLMGLPAGWVTDIPGLSRNDYLRLLGNGVVPQQGAAALRLLLSP